jgi:hypothetical protein
MFDDEEAIQLSVIKTRCCSTVSDQAHRLALLVVLIEIGSRQARRYPTAASVPSFERITRAYHSRPSSVACDILPGTIR